MVLFGIAFGILELIAIAISLVFLVPIASYSRYRGTLHTIWPVAVLCGIVMAIVYWSEWTFSGAFSALFSLAFLQQVAIYLVIGLLYSGLEFCFVARKSAKKHEQLWDNKKRQKYSVKIKPGEPVPPELVSYEIIKDQETKSPHAEVFSSQDLNQQDSLTSRLYHAPLHIVWPHLSSREKGDIITSFCANSSYATSPAIIRIGMNDKGEISPVIDTSELAEYVVTWTVFWPLYAIALLFDDFITTLFEKISVIMSKVFSGVVARLYSNVFKI